MEEINEEVYTTIFNALRHGVRRNILRMLNNHELSFSTMEERLSLSSSHLTYHLDSLKELISKTENGYRLSIFGEAAVDMIKKVEEPPKVPVSSHYDQKTISLLLFIGIVIASGLYVSSFMNNQNLTIEYQAQTTQLEEATNQLELVQPLYELSQKHPSRRYGDFFAIVSSYSINYKHDISNYPPHEVREYFDFYARFYSPMDNLVLKITPQKYYPLDELAYPLTLQSGDAIEYWSNGMGLTYPSELSKTPTILYDVLFTPIIWEKNVTTNNIIEVNLPKAGWYTLCMTGPIYVSIEGDIEFKGAIVQTENGTVHIPENVDIWIDFSLLNNGEEVLFGVID